MTQRTLSSSRYELQIYPPRLPARLARLAAVGLFLAFLWGLAPVGKDPRPEPDMFVWKEAFALFSSQGDGR